MRESEMNEAFSIAEYESYFSFQELGDGRDSYDHCSMYCAGGEL